MGGCDLVLFSIMNFIAPRANLEGAGAIAMRRVRTGLVVGMTVVCSVSGIAAADDFSGNRGVLPPLFSDVSASVLPASYNVDARSASLADIDNDGDLDLFYQGASGSQRLLRNNLIGLGSLTFTEILGNLPSGIGPSWSACWGDYNGDGFVDVFVGQSNTAGGAAGDVLLNDGTGVFTNASVATGLDDPGFHQNVAWADIDGDEDLDLIIAMEGPIEKHEIYLQGPGSVFTPVGAAVGFQQAVGVKAYGMAIGDTDGDGDLDIYISTCRGDNNIRNNFYENQLVESGSLGFIDIADSNGTQFMTNSYGAEFYDFDDDGDLDLFMVGADSEPSKIWRNDGGNMFTDVDTLTGHTLLTDVAGDLNGGRAVDYDNDGDLDLFLHDHDARNGSDTSRKLYRNDGNWEFTDVTAVEGLEQVNRGSYDSPWGDIDNDGDMDLIATTDSAWIERVFLNGASTNGNHWFGVRLIGTASNTTAIGAAVYATIESGTPSERTIRREANTNAGTFNQSDLPVHFGLGSATSIDRLRIVWPNGAEREYCDVAVDQYTSIHFPRLGDFDGDGQVASGDLQSFVDCYAGPSQPVNPTSGYCDTACAQAFDADSDSDVDLTDFAAFQSEFDQ